MTGDAATVCPPAAASPHHTSRLRVSSLALTLPVETVCKLPRP